MRLGDVALIQTGPEMRRGIAELNGEGEVAGGIAVAIGLLTRPAAFVLAGEMAVAYFTVHQSQGALPIQNHGEPAVLSVQAPFTVTEGDSAYVVAPAKALRFTVTIEWPHPLIGRQAGTYDVTAESFAAELAPARTFGFARNRPNGR